MVPFTFCPSKGVQWALEKGMWLGTVHSCSRSTCQSHGLCQARAAACNGSQGWGAPAPAPRPSTPHLHIGVLLGRQVEDAPRVVVQSLQQVIQAEPALAHCRQQ